MDDEYDNDEVDGNGRNLKFDEWNDVASFVLFLFLRQTKITSFISLIIAETEK